MQASKAPGSVFNLQDESLGDNFQSVAQFEMLGPFQIAESKPLAPKKKVKIDNELKTSKATKYSGAVKPEDEEFPRNVTSARSFKLPQESHTKPAQFEAVEIVTIEKFQLALKVTENCKTAKVIYRNSQPAKNSAKTVCCVCGLWLRTLHILHLGHVISSCLLLILHVWFM